MEHSFAVYYLLNDVSSEETIDIDVVSFQAEETVSNKDSNDHSNKKSLNNATAYHVNNNNFENVIEGIKLSNNTDVTLIIEEDIKLQTAFNGIENKHVMIQSSQENCFSINMGKSFVGDITLDNISAYNSSSTIFANGHRFETTENFSNDKTRNIKCIYGGGDIGNDIIGDTNIILRGNIDVSFVYGGGKDSQVSGSTHILMDDKNTRIGTIWGGGHALTTKNGKVNGDTNTVLKQGKNGFLFGGGQNVYAFANDLTTREPASVEGTSNVTVGYKDALAHSVEFGTSMYAYGGSWNSTVGNVNFQILEGAWSDIRHTGRNYYGCGYRDTVRGVVNITVDGADLSDDSVFGGGGQDSSMNNNYGDIEILNEKNAPYALQINYDSTYNTRGINAGSDKSVPTLIKGNVLINIENGNMDYAILDNENSGHCTIDEIGTIHITGTSSIAQVQGNTLHNNEKKEKNSQVVYDGCGSISIPQKTGYIYKVGLVGIKNKANVLIDSEEFSQFDSIQKPFFTVKNIEIIEQSILTTRNSQTTIQDSVKINDGTWHAKGYVYVYETLNSKNAHIFFDNYFAVGYNHKSDSEPKNHTSFNSESDELVALNSGYTGQFYGNVKLDNSDLALMCPVNVLGNWSGGKSILRLPAVKSGENYDGSSTGGTIPLNIDGIADGETTVNTVTATDWKTLQKPILKDNYITGYTVDKEAPKEATFILGNEDALADRYYLKRVTDPADEENYFMWQVARKETYHVTYEFISGTKDKELPKEVTDLLPKDNKEYEHGSTITAIQPLKTTVAVSDGVWTFEGWDSDKEVASSNVKFTGTWKFIEKSSVGVDTKDTTNRIIFIAMMLTALSFFGFAIQKHFRKLENDKNN